MTSDSTSLLIEDVTVVSVGPLIGVVYGGDILVLDGMVAAVGTDLIAHGVEVLDGRGTIAIPASSTPTSMPGRASCVDWQRPSTSPRIWG